jgi:hypothetical protein
LRAAGQIDDNNVLDERQIAMLELSTKLEEHIKKRRTRRLDIKAAMRKEV